MISKRSALQFQIRSFRFAVSDSHSDSNIKIDQGVRGAQIRPESDPFGLKNIHFGSDR